MTFIESKVLEETWLPLNTTPVEIIQTTNPWWFILAVTVIHLVYSELKAKCSTGSTFRQRW